MKRTLTYIVTIVAALGLLISCADLGEIEKRINSLDSRVTALETVTENLNKNIEALQKLSEAAFIKSVTSNANGYTIELSNGDKLEILNGTEGQGIAPLLRINSEGKWEVNYSGDASNTAAWQLIGSGIPATGENGATPIFGVDADGYWTVRYSETETPVRVKDANGSDVKAVSEGSGDSFFQSVEYDESNNVLNVTVAGGKALSVPVIKDLSFIIKGADNKPVTDIVTLSRGENKIYTVEAKGIADASIITRPDGWNASLSMESGMTSGQLEIIAPPATKSGEVIADSRTDISILVLSTKGFAFMAKLKVQLDGATIYEPTASIDENVTATESTLTFIVNTLHTDGYYYKAVKHEGETVPETPSTADLRNGTKETQPTLTISGLDKNSTYTLFVLPVNGETNGEIKSMTAKTSYGEITDYYDAYLAGLDIVIAGETYNKTTHPEAVLIEANSGDVELTAYNENNLISSGGLYFLRSNGSNKFTVAAGTGQAVPKELIFISCSKDQKETIQIGPGQYFSLRGESFILKNIILDMSQRNNYAFNMTTASEQMKNLHIEGCKLIYGTSTSQALLSVGSSTYTNSITAGITSIRIIDTDIQLPNSATFRLFTFVTPADYSIDLSKFEEITLRNNLIFSSRNNGVNFQIFNYSEGATVPEADAITNVNLTNNTFYNVDGRNVFMKFVKLKSIKIENNLFYRGSIDQNLSVYRLFGTAKNAESIIAENNYIETTSSKFARYNYNATENNDITNVTGIFSVANADTGTFTPIEAYKSYGAQR